MTCFMGMGELLTSYLPSGILIAIIVLAVVAVIAAGVIIWVALRKVKIKEKPQELSEAEEAEKKAPAEAEEPKTEEYAALQTAQKTAASETTAYAEAASANAEETEISAEATEISVAAATANEEEEQKPLVYITKNGGKVYVMYDYSFKARLIQSSADTQRRYHEIKEYLLSYGLKRTEGRKSERYFYKGKTYAKIAFRGKRLCVNFAIFPDQLPTKYHVEDVSDVKKYADIPCLYRIKNERRCAYAKQITDIMLAPVGLTRTPNETPFVYLPYEERDELVKKGLIRMKASAESGGEILPADFEAMKTHTFVTVGGVTVAPEGYGEVAATDEEDDDKPSVFLTRSGGKVYVVYDYSFKARLIQSPSDTQRRHHEIKEYLLSYGLKCSEGRKAERYFYKGKTYAKMTFRGRTLCVNLALSVGGLDDKYKVEDVSDVKKYADIPCLYRIKNERRCVYAKQLIDIMLTETGLTRTPNETPCVYLPYETREQLIEEDLVRMKATAESGEEILPADFAAMKEHDFITVGGVTVEKVGHISAEEAAETADEIAEAVVETEEYSTGRNKTIVNIDKISESYKNGETVTVESLRARGLIPKKADYVKVLARGTLDKSLTVKAQEFSKDAVKMIVLVGGTAIKIKVKR